MIHQSDTNNASDSTSPYYNLSEYRHYDSKQTAEPMSAEQQDVFTSSHHEDEQIKPISDTKLRRSASSSSSSTTSASKRADSYDLTSTNNVVLPARNSNLHRSLETISHKISENEQGLKPTNKTTSLEFGTRPGRYDDPGSIYITPQEATHPASQYQDVVKGWLRKQNRGKIKPKMTNKRFILIENRVIFQTN
jgi:hypothetical protein